MKRREFARGLIGAGVLATLGSIDLGAAVKALPGAVLDDRPADHFRLARAALADSDNLFGPRQVIPTAIGQVQAIQQVRRAARGRDLRELLQVQTQFADLLGWLHQDGGDFRSAQYWMDRALEWAHLAGDHDSIVFVLARKSQLAGDMGDSIEAVGVAEAAMTLAGSGSRLGAVAATYAAHGHALDGDRGECDRLYDHARTLLDLAGADDSPWGRFFDASYIGVQRARSIATLGDHRAAADGFRAAIEGLQPGYRRDQGVYLAREALAYAGLEDTERSTALGMQALAIGAETGSGRIFGELGSLDDALRELGAAGSEVSTFRAALTETTANSA